MHFKLVFYFFSASLLWITTLEICDHHGMLTIISGFIQYQPCNLSSRDFSTQIKIRGAVAGFFCCCWSIYEIHHNAWPIIENKNICNILKLAISSQPISWRDSSVFRFKCNGTHWWNTHTHRTHLLLLCGKCRSRTVLMHIIFWCSRRWPYYICYSQCVKFCTCRIRNCSNWMYTLSPNRSSSSSNLANEQQQQQEIE